MKINLFATSLVLIAIAFPAFAETEERAVSGAVVKVQTSARVMTINDSTTRERLDIYIPETAIITMDGKPAKLFEFKRGNLATIRFITRSDGTNEAVVVRVPNPETIVAVPAEEPVEVAQMKAVTLPKTASNQYVALYLALGLLLVGGAAFVTRRLLIAR